MSNHKDFVIRCPRKYSSERDSDKTVPKRTLCGIPLLKQTIPHTITITVDDSPAKAFAQQTTDQSPRRAPLSQPLFFSPWGGNAWFWYQQSLKKLMQYETHNTRNGKSTTTMKREGGWDAPSLHRLNCPTEAPLTRCRWRRGRTAWVP